MAWLVMVGAGLGISFLSSRLPEWWWLFPVRLGLVGLGLLLLVGGVLKCATGDPITD
tara:strand:- start:17873 stop:18043 length:171 start_codon:yes stop_codon:yes gene_type:complete